MSKCKFAATVEVPMHSIILLKNKDIYECEKRFKDMIDNAKDLREKNNYQKCCAVLKWAATCGASLTNISNNVKDRIVKFEFNFSQMKEMRYFKEKLEENTRI